jgi:hypothetical protein
VSNRQRDMTTSKRIGLVAAAAAALLLLGVAMMDLSSSEAALPREAPADAMGREPGPVAEALPPAPVRAERPRDTWQAKRDRIRGLRRHRSMLVRRSAVEEQSRDEAGRCSEDCWGTLQLQLRLADVIEGCRELLPPEARGTARFDANVIAEPGIGAVVESVEVVDDAIGAEEFRDCIVEAALLAELADPGAPVSDRFRFRYSAGPRADNAASFLTAHPELVEQHPQLAVLRDRAIDAPRSDGDATTFATTLTSDPAALAAFEQWSVEQGIDLSGVRTEE